jgi:YD repeat-containing protein
MQFRDGSAAFFLDCRARVQPCSVIERRDPDGHRIDYERDTSGLLLRMSSDGQSITFDYDDSKRIVRARDTSGRQVTYTYDEGGRLVRAVTSDGTVRDYRYDARNNLTRIQEPGRIVENWFDDADRWTRQVVKSSEDDRDPYIATVRYVVENGSVVETDFDEGDGLEVLRFNPKHYIASETLFADSPTPVTFTYDLDPTTNVVRSASMSCTGQGGPVTRAVRLTSHDDEAKAQAIESACVLRR